MSRAYGSCECAMSSHSTSCPSPPIAARACAAWWRTHHDGSATRAASGSTAGEAESLQFFQDVKVGADAGKAYSGNKFTAVVFNTKVDDAGLHTRVNGEDKLFAVDTVIVCAGQTPLRTLYDTLVAKGVKATLVGGAFEAAELDVVPDTETRYMDVDIVDRGGGLFHIVAACSDSLVR